MGNTFTRLAAWGIIGFVVLFLAFAIYVGR